MHRAPNTSLIGDEIPAPNPVKSMPKPRRSTAERMATLSIVKNTITEV
ncbi:MAG: hypothetical protein QY319_01685 [Candidatus Kapaibacterium sp.]|nr:hypothetical protein [Candidatus Kapabacteria bacterium]MCC6331477.1 hypothetical protein [Ignavibacteria bacterium]NOG67157.1 hypothetical protein [Chlorobiota bacterium]MCL4277125.1 hypothetical protein [Ignavibacteria bacterium]QOJ25130.1 MAG: hypothetical protein HRU79_00155 [Ignavibacteria bacterium]